MKHLALENHLTVERREPAFRAMRSGWGELQYRREIVTLGRREARRYRLRCLAERREGENYRNHPPPKDIDGANCVLIFRMVS